ncbi:hypothetical protein PVK06_023304 [Gossypium arboreum]|uniref:Uncharacterized protein n=1 Tax=Gossypium arboreum TaxID=29729 RepID=A0ABR0PB60_GOSAR|nr:hypothetical protein PVK06_023304 [Gossypium arboreum]
MSNADEEITRLLVKFLKHQWWRWRAQKKGVVGGKRVGLEWRLYTRAQGRCPRTEIGVAHRGSRMKGSNDSGERLGKGESNARLDSGKERRWRKKTTRTQAEQQGWSKVKERF